MPHLKYTDLPSKDTHMLSVHTVTIHTPCTHKNMYSQLKFPQTFVPVGAKHVDTHAHTLKHTIGDLPGCLLAIGT